MSAFVPDDFDVPNTLEREHFRLEPLGVEHNEADHRAWMSSIEHIHASPGFEERRWPVAMSLEENAADLRAHADDFAARRGFTYTVVGPDGDVIGCVYIYPDEATAGAHVRSWVRADHAPLDPVLRQEVASWLAREWPFTAVRFEGVDGPGAP